MPQQILVVDDEEAIADLVEVYLTNEGFAVRNSTVPLQRWKAWRHFHPV